MPPLFLPMLLGWCAAWTIATGVAWLRSIGVEDPAERRRKAGFWGMTIFWIAINVAIGAWAAFDPVTDVAEFRRLVLVNGGLDVLYLITGFILIRRKDPLVTGFGLAILLQGAFLLVLDLGWWWWLGSAGS